MLNEKNKPRPWFYFITYLWCICVDLLFWFLIGVVLYSLWGTKRHWAAGCLCLEFEEGSWPMQTWYKKWLGTTFGHTILYAPGRSGEKGVVDTSTERHEMIHVHQFEVMQLVAAAITVWTISSGFEWQRLLLLFCGSSLAYLASMVQALIRGESPYRDNIFEDHAYAVDGET